MSQQINLLNPALLKKKDFINPVSIVAAFAFILVSMTTMGMYEQLALRQTKAEHEKSAAALANAQHLLTQIRTQKASSNLQARAKATIETLEKKQTMQKAVLEAAKHDKANHSESYAAILTAFAKQSIDGLWLTGLSIDQDAQHLRISGRTLNPDLVPAYIAKLRNEPALAGKQFTDLNMQYKEVEQKLTAKTETVSSAQSTVAQSDTEHTLTIPYIEFTLQSVNDASASVAAKGAQQTVAGVSR